MLLSEFKDHLTQAEDLTVLLPNGQPIPTHFHLTELGLTTKEFVDCGGTRRSTKKVNFQLWYANDTDHRLAPSKLLNIINNNHFQENIDELEIEVEYQTGPTIGLYGLDISDGKIRLTPRHTECLAHDKCGIPDSLLPVAETTTSSSCCTPGSGCC